MFFQSGFAAFAVGLGGGMLMEGIVSSFAGARDRSRRKIGTEGLALVLWVGGRLAPPLLKLGGRRLISRSFAGRDHAIDHLGREAEIVCGIGHAVDRGAIKMRGDV